MKTPRAASPMPPLRANAIFRTRLIRTLQAAKDYPLTVISAQAGYGKTTLLSSWIAEERTRSPEFDSTFCWITITEEENDLRAFLFQLSYSLQSSFGEIGSETAAMLAGPPPAPPLPAIADSLIREMQSADHAHILLLDDLHAIQTKEVFAFLSDAIERSFPAVRWIVSSRMEPALPLARMRVRHQLLEITAEDLRFTREEASAFFHKTMDLPVSDREVEQLEERTRGWAAALQLAGLSIRGKPDSSTAIRSFTGGHPHLVDYLGGEVLEGCSAPVRKFLLRTSILRRMNPAICDALFPAEMGSSSAAMLKSLERENLFLQPCDPERAWFQYHPLFLEFLRSRCERELAPEIPELHRRAMAWWKSYGDADEAAYHAFLAGERTEAACIVEELCGECLRRGEIAGIFRHLANFSEAEIDAHAGLSIVRAWAFLLSGEIDLAEKSATILRDKHRGDEIEGIASAILVSVAGYRNDIPAMMSHAESALQLLPESSEHRITVLFNAANVHIALGEIPEAKRRFEEVAGLGARAGNIHLSVLALATLAQIHLQEGKLSAAENTCGRALQLARMPDGSPHPIAGAAFSTLAMVRYLRNDLSEAEQDALRAKTLGEASANYLILVSALLTQAQIHQAQNRSAEAQATFARVDAMVHELSRHPSGKQLEALQAQSLIMRGETRKALAWANSIPKEGIVRYLEMGAYKTAARVRLEEGRFAEANAFLERAKATASQTGSYGFLLDADILAAILHLRHGKRELAREAMISALDLGRSERSIRPFADLGGEIRELLLEIYGSGKPRESMEYIRLLLANIPSANPPGEALGLTDREVELIRFMDQGLTNEEIAKKMVVAVSTVKKHINHIFAKLGAKTRTQALVRAKELRIL